MFASRVQINMFRKKLPLKKNFEQQNIYYISYCTMFSSLEHSLQDDQLQLALKQAGKHSEVGEKIRLIVVVLYRRPAQPTSII